MNAYQNGSPSALEGEAEQTRDVPTADLATGLVDKAKALQQSKAWEEKTRVRVAGQPLRYATLATRPPLPIQGQDPHHPEPVVNQLLDGRR